MRDYSLDDRRYDRLSKISTGYWLISIETIQAISDAVAQPIVNCPP